MFLPTATYSRTAYRGVDALAPGDSARLGIAQAVVLHQALDEPVEGQVVAAELLVLAVLADGDDVEALAAALLLGDPGRCPPVGDRLLELGHHRIVPPTRHGPPPL